MEHPYSKRPTERIDSRLETLYLRLGTSDFRFSCLMFHVSRLMSCVLCLSLLSAFYSYCDIPINTLVSMRVSLARNADTSSDSMVEESGGTGNLLTVQIEGTQPIDYETDFVEANAEKPQRFYIDINNSILDTGFSQGYGGFSPFFQGYGGFSPYWVLDSGIQHPVSSVQYPEPFPISKMVVAQHALRPPVTRVVFHLRDQINPLTEADSNLLIVRIPIPNAGCPTPDTSIQNSVSSVGNAISLDAKDADIRDILLGLAQANNINLIMDDSVQGRCTICLNDVSPTDAIELILHTNGFVTEKVGDSIVAATPEALKNILPPISRIITLQYASASDLKQSLTPGLAGGSGETDIQADTRTNSLIITGTAAGVRRVEQAIELLDTETPPEPQRPTAIRVFPLKYAQASILQALTSELCSPAGKVRVDDRTNSLIITDEIAVIERLAEAIAQLDIQSPSDSRGMGGSPHGETAADVYTRVFKLNYIDANALKDVLQEMLSPNGKIQSLVTQKEFITPVQPDDMGAFAGDQRVTSRSSSSDTYATEQKWSDILIVTDTASVISRMDDLISRLDTRTAQVMIEARMVEISLSDAESLGIDWQATHSPSKSTLGEQFPAPGLTGGSTDGINLQIGTLSTKHFEDIMFKLQALETSGQAKLISNPSVITLDNELAQMIVADRIPIPKTYETEFRATTSYEFINVGIVLTVIPHITEDGYILMDAMPEVNSIKEWTTGENPQPIISSRVAHSRVRVRDAQTLVIGGLIKDEQRERVSRVPVLCGIPFLGRLFRTKGVDNVKTDLVVFITPQICKDGP
jgi:general secretion pathway protein D